MRHNFILPILVSLICILLHFQGLSQNTDADKAKNDLKKAVTDLKGLIKPKKESAASGSDAQTAQSTIPKPVRGDNSQLKPGDVLPGAKIIDADLLEPFSGGAAMITKGESTALIDAKGNFIAPYNTYKIMTGPIRNFGHTVIQNGIYRFQDAGKITGGFINGNGKIIEKSLRHGFTWDQRVLEAADNNQWSYIRADGKGLFIPAHFSKSAKRSEE